MLKSERAENIWRSLVRRLGSGQMRITAAFPAVLSSCRTSWLRTVEEMRAALAELDKPDMEHPSTWLSDDDGWTVDVYESGLVIFSHQSEDVCERRGVSRDEALKLWLLLQQGRRDEIRQRLSA